MAILLWVTLSIPALSKGIFKLTSLVKFVAVSTSRGRTEDFPGTNNTSSKVSPTLANLSSDKNKTPFYSRFCCTF
jgi:hypothetical protein